MLKVCIPTAAKVQTNPNIDLIGAKSKGFRPIARLFRNARQIHEYYLVLTQFLGKLQSMRKRVHNSQLAWVMSSVRNNIGKFP